MPEATIRQAVNLSEDWMILIFLFTLAALAYTRKVYPARIARLWNSMWNIRTMRQSIREEPNTPRANFLFNTSFYFLAALIAYTGIKCFQPTIWSKIGFFLYPILVSALFLLYLLKKIVLRFISFVTDGDYSLSEYEYGVFMTNRFLVLVLFPLALGTTYFPVFQAKGIIIAAVVLIVLAVIYRVIRSVITAIESGVTPFYILFYICTLEILPSALGIKWLTTF